MKKLFPLIILCVLTINSCGEVKKQDGKEQGKSKIEFENTSFDFGKIAFGSDGTCVFKFTNTSKESLIVNVVRTSCGCTNPEWPKDPVEPGKSGEINITYNTRITGKFRKSITVYCNAVNSPAKLSIMGEVKPETLRSSSSKK